MKSKRRRRPLSRLLRMCPAKKRIAQKPAEIPAVSLECCDIQKLAHQPGIRSASELHSLETVTALNSVSKTLAKPLLPLPPSGSTFHLYQQQEANHCGKLDCWSQRSNSVQSFASEYRRARQIRLIAGDPTAALHHCGFYLPLSEAREQYK